MRFPSVVLLVALSSAAPTAHAEASPEPSAPTTNAETAAGAGWERPEISVRLDPFSWVLEGRLGVELEVAVAEALSVELVPVFVTSESPPTYNLVGRDDNLLQSSNGFGPLSGASLSVGWWLDGTPFRGPVLRGILTNYGYELRAVGEGVTLDRVDHTERELIVFFGSYSRWGAFSIGGGIGLGLSLTRQRRCFDVPEGAAPSVSFATSDCRDDEHLIALEPDLSSVINLNDSLAPALFMGRLSMGVTF